MSKIPFPLLLLFAVLSSPPLLLAQSAEKKLVDVYGEERVNELRTEHSKKYEYLLFKLEHGYRVRSAREGKDYPERSEVPYFVGKAEDSRKISSTALLQKLEDGSFNFLMCRLERSKGTSTPYELKGTGKVLILLSEDRVAKKFNQRR